MARGIFLLCCITQTLSCRIEFADPGLNPGSAHWEFGVLATGPLGMSHIISNSDRGDWYQCKKKKELSFGNLEIILQISSFQFGLSVLSDTATPWTTARQTSLSITNSRSLPRLTTIESVMPPNYLIRCRPLFLLPSIFPSIRVFSNGSVFHIRWPKYWSFSFNICPSDEFSRLLSFRMDWFDLLAVQGTLKSPPQHHSSKASVLQCSAFFIVQLSHPYMTTGKTIPLTIWTFVDKVLSLLFNMLSRLVIAFLPRSKCFLIS